MRAPAVCRALAALAFVLALHASPRAQGASAALPDELRLFVGETRVLDVRPTRVAVGNGEIVSVTTLASGQLLLIAGNPGRTSIEFWYQDRGASRMLIDVAAADLAATLAGVRELLGDVQGIVPAIAAGRIVLQGTAIDGRALERASAISALYPAVVLNFVGKIGAEPMVHFEVRILEVRSRALRDVGVRWSEEVNGPNGAVIGDVITNDLYRARPTSPDVAGLVNRPLPRRVWPPKLYFGWTAAIESRIRLLEQQGDARIVAEPTLSCRSGGSARFVSGGELPIPVIDPQGGADVEFREYGVILDVKPIVDPSGLVIASIDTEVSQIDGSQSVLGIPALLKRRTATEVNMREGETLVIAGLVNQSSSRDEQRLPGLGRSRGVGAAFRARQRRTESSELAIFITPRLVHPAPAAFPVAQESTREREERLRHGEIPPPDRVQP